MVQKIESIHGGNLWKIESICCTVSHLHEPLGQYVIENRLLKNMNIELKYLHFKCLYLLQSVSI